MNNHFLEKTTICHLQNLSRIPVVNLLGLFSRQQIDDIFLIFPRKQVLTFHANWLQWRQFARNVKTFFYGKNKRSISVCCLLKILPSMFSIEEMLTVLEHLVSSPCNWRCICYFIYFHHICHKGTKTYL